MLQRQYERVEVISQAAWIADAFMDVAKAIAEEYVHFSLVLTFLFFFS
jgi:hypothetical protein